MHPWNDRSNGSACFPGLWESVRKCGTAVQACLQRQAVCVNVLPGLTMGVGCSRWYLKEKEWEREKRVWFTSHPCEHIKTNTTVNMSELVSERTSVCVLAWASSLAESLIADSLSPAFLRSHRARGAQQYTRKANWGKKKEREAVGLRKGGTSVSTFPHLNVFLHSWQQPTMSSQGEMGLEKEWKRTSKTKPGKWISALFSD